MEYLSVSEAARKFGAKPKQISDLLYHRVLRDDLCPIVGGRRLIPRSYLPKVLDVLIKQGFVEPSEQKELRDA